MSTTATPRHRERPDAVEASGPSPLPAWPVLCLLWGLPLWWASGLFGFCTILVALPMIHLLIERRHVSLIPGVAPLAALVIWSVPSAYLVESSGDLIGFAVRWAQFASLVVVMVYLVNARETLTTVRVIAGLCAWWVVIIGLGYLALALPEARLSLTVGRFLPGSITANDYVRDLVFPPLNEIQHPYGSPDPFIRPAAPFPYANGWGAAMAILTPVAVANALVRRTLAAWTLLVVGCMAMVVPMNASGNRGMLLTLAVVVVLVALRFAGRGRGRALAVLVVGAFGVILVLQRVGVFEALRERQETVDTTTGRLTLYMETFTRTLSSPLIGFGAPRASRTTEVTVGTQGMAWSMMFCFGFVGLAFFVWFLLGTVARTWAAPGSAAIWLNSMVAAMLVMSLFYGMDRQLIPLTMVMALLLRERYLAPDALWPVDGAARAAPPVRDDEQSRPVVERASAQR
jgi:hypothetical protein